MADAFDDELSTLPSGDQGMELGIITESSKYPDFAVETRRKETFLTWPAANHKLASEMIEHQLFYTGTTITVGKVASVPENLEHVCLMRW